MIRLYTNKFQEKVILKEKVDVKEILKNLIQRAVVFPESNTSIIDYVSSFFVDSSFVIEKYSNPKNLNSNSLSIRTNLPNRPYLFFSGHLDVVPTDCQPDHSGRWCYSLSPPPKPADEAWIVPAKNITVSGNRLFGRGSADMLGGVAALLSCLTSIQPSSLKYNVALIFTDDEERDLQSINRVLDIVHPKVRDKGIHGCFVCEPTEMKPLIGQRGISRGSIEIIGRGSHVSRPDLGVDIFKEVTSVYNHMLCLCNNEQKEIGEDKRFIPAGIYCRVADIQTYSTSKHSVSGIKLNFVISHLPNHNIQKILKNMTSYVRILDTKLKKKDPSIQAKFDILKSYASFLCDSRSAFFKDIETSFKSKEIQGASFGSEAPAFSERGIPTVLLGPGSILQAHTRNEYTECTQLEKAKRFFMRYLTQGNVDSHSLAYINQMYDNQKNRSR